MQTEGPSPTAHAEADLVHRPIDTEEHGHDESETGSYSGGDDDTSAAEAVSLLGVDQPTTFPTTEAHTIRSIREAKRECQGNGHEAESLSRILPRGEVGNGVGGLRLSEVRRETGGTRASVGSVMKLLALASAGGRRRLDEQASQANSSLDDRAETTRPGRLRMMEPENDRADISPAYPVQIVVDKPEQVSVGNLANVKEALSQEGPGVDFERMAKMEAMMKQNEGAHAQLLEEKEEIIQKLGVLLKTTAERLKSLRDCSRDAIIQRDQRVSELESALVKFSILLGGFQFPHGLGELLPLAEFDPRESNHQIVTGLLETLSRLDLNSKMTMMTQGSSASLRHVSQSKKLSVSKPELLRENVDAYGRSLTPGEDYPGGAFEIPTADIESCRPHDVLCDVNSTPANDRPKSRHDSGAEISGKKPGSMISSVKTTSQRFPPHSSKSNRDEWNSRINSGEIVHTGSKVDDASGRTWNQCRRRRMQVSGSSLNVALQPVKGQRTIVVKPQTQSEFNHLIKSSCSSNEFKSGESSSQSGENQYHKITAQTLSLASHDAIVDSLWDSKKSVLTMTEKIFLALGIVKEEDLKKKKVAMDEGDNVYEGTIFGHLTTYISLFLIVSFVILDICACCYYQVFFRGTDFTCSAGVDSDGNPTVVLQPQAIAILGSIVVVHFTEMVFSIMHDDSAPQKKGMRGFKMRLTKMSRTWQEGVFRSLDLVIFVASILVIYYNSVLCLKYSIPFQSSVGNAPWDYRLVRRIHIAVHVIRAIMFLQKVLSISQRFTIQLQTVVSMNRRRFIDFENNFNLDLTYILDRIIATSIPCVDSAPYRNDIRDFARFLATRHYGKFRIFNLCQAFEESGNGNYDNKLLYDQVQKIPLRDHDVPPLYILILFCEMATAWLNKDAENVIAVHCRGGKGRTGTFCCALLLWLGIVNTAENAMMLFASRRTHLQEKSLIHNALQGVSAPCQRRYLFYMEEIVYNATDWFNPRLVLLTNVRMVTMPLLRQEFVRMCMIVECNEVVEYDSAKEDEGVRLMQRRGPQNDLIDFEIPGGLPVQGDVHVRFFVFESQGDPPRGSNKPSVVSENGRSIDVNGVKGTFFCSVAFHTSFHNPGILTFTKDEIDGACSYDDKDISETFMLQVIINDDLSTSLPDEYEDPQFDLKGRLIRKKQKVAETMYTTYDLLTSYVCKPMSANLEALKDDMHAKGAMIGARSKWANDHPDRQLEAQGASLGLKPGAVTKPQSRPFKQLQQQLFSDLTLDEMSRRVRSEIVSVEDVNVEESKIAIVPAGRNFLLKQRVRDIFETMGEERLYFRGQQIFDPGFISSAYREIYMITDGYAQWIDENSGDEKIYRGDTVAGMVVLTGDVVNELGFILGCEMESDRCRLFAKSPVVKCRVITVYGDTTCVCPIAGNPLKFSQMADLFEWVAKLQSQKSQQILRHTGKFHVEEPIKKEKKSAYNFDESIVYIQIYQRLAARFGLAAVEDVIGGTKGYIMLKNGVSVPGLMICTKNWVIWVAYPHSISGVGLNLCAGKAIILSTKAFVSCSTMHRILRIDLLNHYVPDMIDVTAADINGPGMWSTILGTFESFARTASLVTGEGTLDSADKLCMEITENEVQLKTIRFFHDNSDDGIELCVALQRHMYELCFHKNVAEKSTGYSLDGLKMTRQFFLYLLPDEELDIQDFAAVDQILKGARRITFEDKQVIISIGETQKMLYHIADGFATCHSASGQFLAKLGVGDICGEIAFMDCGNRGAGAVVRAEGKCECLAITIEAMECMSRLNPRAGARFARGLAILTCFRLRHAMDMVRSRQGKWAPKLIVKSKTNKDSEAGTGQPSSLDDVSRSASFSGNNDDALGQQFFRRRRSRPTLFDVQSEHSKEEETPIGSQKTVTVSSPMSPNSGNQGNLPPMRGPLHCDEEQMC